MTILEAKSLHKSYKTGSDKIIVINDISLSISEGEFVGIYGVSGSGKTTLLNILGLIDSPTFGEVLIDGKPTKNMDKKEISGLRNSFFGYLHQSFGLLNDFTVFENVEMPMLMTSHKAGYRNKRINDILEQLEIQDKSQTFPYLLSGGQAQRVALARSLVNNPRLILTDEPTASLDSLTGLSIVKLLRKLVHDNNSQNAVIMVTHDEAFHEYFDRVLFLKDGKLME